MAMILNIETSTKNCSVSLSNNGILCILVEQYNDHYCHAEKLHLFIEYALKVTQIKKSDINAICVSKGPGSYTGIRIGVTAAQALCFALDIPLLSINTLYIMQEGFYFNSNDGILIPMIDARRNEVYTSVFDKKIQIASMESKILDENSFQEYQKNNIYIFGDGAKKAEKLLNIHATYFPNFYPSARYIANISDSIFNKKEFEDLEKFEPIYLK